MNDGTQGASKREGLLLRGEELLECTTTASLDHLAADIDIWRHEVGAHLAEEYGHDGAEWAAFTDSSPPGKVSSEFATRHDNDQWRRTYRTSMSKALITLRTTTDPTPEMGTDVKIDKERRVMAIHGRNQDAQRAMFSFLRSIGLRPMEFSEAVVGTKKTQPYIGEVLEHLLDQAQAVVALLTPDEIAYLRNDYKAGEDDPDLMPQGQARPNVLFEAGMAMGRKPDRTILVELGKMRGFTDVSGIHTVRMSNGVDKRQDLASRLRNAGCPVDLNGTHWHNEGDFSPPPPLQPTLGKRLPTSKTQGAAVRGKWINSGGNRLDQVKLTNVGSVPLFHLQLVVPDGLADDIQLHDHDTPVAKLPVGETMTARAWSTRKTMGPSAAAQFELRAVGRLEDGTPFEDLVYFDAG